MPKKIIADVGKLSFVHPLNLTRIQIIVRDTISFLFTHANDLHRMLDELTKDHTVAKQTVNELRADVDWLLAEKKTSDSLLKELTKTRDRLSRGRVKIKNLWGC